MRQREIGDFPDRDNQTQQGDEPGIAAPQENDFPLQLSHVAFEHVERDDIGM